MDAARQRLGKNSSPRGYRSGDQEYAVLPDDGARDGKQGSQESGAVIAYGLQGVFQIGGIDNDPVTNRKFVYVLANFRHLRDHFMPEHAGSVVLMIVKDARVGAAQSYQSWSDAHLTGMQARRVRSLEKQLAGWCILADLLKHGVAISSV